MSSCCTPGRYQRTAAQTVGLLKSACGFSICKVPEEEACIFAIGHRERIQKPCISAAMPAIGIGLFIVPHTCSVVSGTAVNTQPANQHWDGFLHSSGFSTEKLTVCQITILAHYLVVFSEIADTLVYIHLVDLTLPVRRTKVLCITGR